MFDAETNTTAPAAFDVSTFVGPGLAGNEARIWLGRAPQTRLTPGLGAQCLLTSEASGYHVACHGAGGPIRFCGHGLLAAAAVALASGERTVLTTSAREVCARRRGDRVWLTLPRLRCHPCPVPGFARRCFNLPPRRAALAGADDDYLILEWPWTTPLTGLEVDLPLLCRHSTRAIIAVQEDRGPHYHYRLRYFAPQYGVDEDAVTGSAHAVAADYWRQRSPDRKRWCGLQASTTGGRVFSHTSGDWISIGGDVRITPTHHTEVFS